MSVQSAVSVAQKDTASIVDVALIHKRKDHNPRKIRSKSKTDDMRESIRANGVLQPVLLRPHPTLTGEYELVAGETRFDMNSEVGRSTIPALIRVIKDEDLLAMASVENVMRQDMGPIDEGNAAKTLLVQHQDKEEVCKILGWSRAKLDGRIHLTHCVDSVAQALCDEEISMGHAQLLSSLRPESQEGALAAIKEQKLSVDDLRGMIEGMALKLASAVFDTTDCAGCPHNSSVQTSLFDAGTSDGRCLNKACFDEKTVNKLQVIKTDLAESYNTVAMDKDVAKGTTAIIASTGASGVGADQAEACVSCEHYGALVGSQVGNEGRVTRSVCFNTKCHAEKVADYRALVETESSSDAGAAESNVVGINKEAEKKPKPKKKAAVASDATPKVILERNHKVRREAASHAAINDQRLAQIVSILSLLADSGVSFKSAPAGWPENLNGQGRAKAAAVLDKMSDEELNELQRQLTARVLSEATKFGMGTNGTDTFGSVAEWVAESRKCDLTEFFVMDAEYLKPHTKPVIEQILTDSGFASGYDATNGEGAFKKLAAGKKGDILTAVSESKFNFKGYLPKGLKSE